jgi:hypothetical protein
MVSSVAPQAAPFVFPALKRLEWPELLPAFRAAIVSQDGVLWLVTSTIDEPTTMVALDSNGRAIKTASLPVPLLPLEVGGDYVLGVYRADGQPHVAIFRFRER